MQTLTPKDLALIAAVVILCLYLARRKSRYPLPPGPRQKLLSWSALQLPRLEPWKVYDQWSRDYGSPVLSYRVFRKQTIVLNSLKAVNELLEARSSIYSERPKMWMYHELLNRKLAVFNLSSQSRRFKVSRKMLQSSLNPRVVRNYSQTQQSECITLLKGFLTSPAKFISHIRRNAGAIVLKISYGWSVVDDDDVLIKIMEEVPRISAQSAQPGRWLVDVFPLLRFIPAWVPGAGFKKQARIWRQQMSQLDMYPHQWVKQQMATGDYVDSFASQHLRPEDGHELDAEEEDIVKWVSQALYAGGADTTVSVVMTFVLVMTVHPDIQRRAQAEIDSVVGTERLPTVDDIGSLPYLHAIFKEVLRFHPVAPLGLPHCVLRDDECMGYHIPRGATIIPNIWAITHNPELYPDPSKFDPDRFWGTKSQHDPRKIVFGFGRRTCPGAHFAEVTAMLNMASILAIFDLLRPLDGQGNEVDLKMEFATGITSHPKPFACRIEPRSEHAKLLVERHVV